MNYYNENDLKTAAWLRELIRARLIPPGDVDERSIVNVKSGDIRGYHQCHFFAGIGGWPLALRLAGWPESRPVWTGSCPCQPFSSAGKAGGVCDERHLWPAFAKLIGKCRPAAVFGEQVASALGRLWLSGVRLDLEGLGYAVGGADLCAAGVSSPQNRARLYWVADAEGQRRNWRSSASEPARGTFTKDANVYRGLEHSDGCHGFWWSGPLQVGWNCIEAEIERGGWKYRAQWRVKPGVPLLADGIPGRVAQLRGFGNAIVPQLAAEFIRAYEETK